MARIWHGRTLIFGDIMRIEGCLPMMLISHASEAARWSPIREPTNLGRVRTDVDTEHHGRGRIGERAGGVHGDGTAVPLQV
jgi:hypothetical protein